MMEDKKNYLAINTDQRLIREVESIIPFYDDRYKIISDEYEINEDTVNNIIKIKYKRMDWRTAEKDFEYNDSVEYPFAGELKKNKIVKGIVYLRKVRSDWQAIEFVGNYVKANIKNQNINSVYKQFDMPKIPLPNKEQMTTMINEEIKQVYKYDAEKTFVADINVNVLTTKKYKFVLNDKNIVVEMKELVKEQYGLAPLKQVNYEVFVEADEDIKAKAIDIVKKKD